MLELGIAKRSLDLFDYGQDADYYHFPDWSDLSISATPSGVSNLTLKYPLSGVRAEYIATGARIRVRFYFNGGKVDPPNMVFEITEFIKNEESSNDNTVTFACKSLKSNFDKLIMAPAIGSTVTDEELFKYTNMTVGQMALEALSVGLSRSPNTVLHPTFTTTHDSAGVEWGRMEERGGR